ncbi:sigma-70 family RNA polymerase sigma factor [Rhodococcus kronopolitis]|uniref:RNA polymerase sigma factor RpoD/SigA n=1 Tax=Rhodococcus kronopolitis TaxID=1460226 RepID=A0ABV9FZT9_9NOCA
MRFASGAKNLTTLIESFTALGIEVRERRSSGTRLPTAGIEVQGTPHRAGGYFQSADGVDWYMERIRRTDLLTAAEEVELMQLIEAGLYAEVKLSGALGPVPHASEVGDLRVLVRAGNQARSTMIEANLRLVAHTARAYQHRGMDLLDLIQEGNTGLMRAVEKFDFTKGNKFSTYATWWIRQAIVRGIADKGRSVRLPVHVVEDIDRLRRLRNDHRLAEGREATDAEIATISELDIDKLCQLDSWAAPVASLDALLEGGGEDRWACAIESIVDVVDDAVDPVEVVFRERLRWRIEAVLECLTDREAAVIALRNGWVSDWPGGWRGLPAGALDGQVHTLDEIGRRFGVTRERIRQIEARTMKMLRTDAELADALRNYFDHLG